MSEISDLSTARLYLLRATYLLVGVGLALDVWPLMLQARGAPPELMKGVVRAVLTAVSLLAFLGVRYPVRMLPLLFFELTWKTIWIVVIGWPLWRTGHLDAASRATWQACLMGLVLFPIAIPWGYVVRQYVLTPGDAWRGKRSGSGTDLQHVRGT